MLPLRLIVHNTALDAATQADIQHRIDHLGRYYDRILSARVTIDVPLRRRRSDRVRYGVRLVLVVPQGQIAIARQPRSTLATALDEALQAARRQLQDHARRLRGDLKRHAPPMRAQVAEWFPLAGYGFLENAAGERFYFDRRAVLSTDADRLGVGTSVRFVPGQGEQGPQASSITVTPRRQAGLSQEA